VISRSDNLRKAGIYVDHQKEIYDARPLNLTLEKDNIEVVPVDFHLEDPHNDDEIREQYVPKILKMMKELTGAKEVFALTPLLRGVESEASWGAKFYTNFTHNDFAPLVEWEDAVAYSKPWKRVVGKHSPSATCGIPWRCPSPSRTSTWPCYTPAASRRARWLSSRRRGSVRTTPCAWCTGTSTAGCTTPACTRARHSSSSSTTHARRTPPCGEPTTTRCRTARVLREHPTGALWR